ncbi:MAG TPA: AsmA family protein [Deltaproteobacteria bacterium]|nr:AsmA family protein [Deltaproteobacteria bacterium]
MFKKIFIGIGLFVATIMVLVIVAGIIIMHKVDKDFIASQMSKALNRQVYIEKIDVSVFSLVSGIEIKNVVISNFKTSRQLSSLQGQPVAANDVFTSMEALRFKIKFLPLLKGQLDLSEFVLYSPVINLSRNRQGVLNIDDLLQPRDKQPPPEKKAPEKEQERMLSADDLPFAVSVGETGIRDGTINYYDGKTGQAFQVYRLTTVAHGIEIDSKDLDKKNIIKLKMGMGLKTVGPMKTGSVQSFDITMDTSGRIIPFDAKTRMLDPELILHLSLPEGEVTGLQVFNSIATIPILGDYLGQYISFLKGTQKWSNSRNNGADLRYKAGNAQISNGRLELEQAKFLFDGNMNTNSKALAVKLNMLMKEEINEKVKAELARKINSVIKNPEVKKYTDANQLAETAMQPLLNKDGVIDLKFKVGGTTARTKVSLVHPRLDSLGKIVKSSAAGILTEAGIKAGKELLGEEKGQVLEGVRDLLRKK